MANLLGVLSSVYTESLELLPEGTSEFMQVLSIEDGLYAIVQRYNTCEDNHFWEVHFDYYDIHIYIDGEEIISLSKELQKEEYLIKKKSDFYVSKFNLSEVSRIRMSNIGVLVIPPKIPHKCVQKVDQNYITKITIKVDKRKFITLLANHSGSDSPYQRI